MVGDRDWQTEGVDDSLDHIACEDCGSSIGRRPHLDKPTDTTNEEGQRMREYRGALSGRIQARLQRSERPPIIELGNLLSHARWLIWRTLGGTYSGPPPDNIEEDDEWTQLWIDKGYHHAGSRTRSYSRGRRSVGPARAHRRRHRAAEDPVGPARADRRHPRRPNPSEPQPPTRGGHMAARVPANPDSASGMAFLTLRSEALPLAPDDEGMAYADDAIAVYEGTLRGTAAASG